MDPVKEQTDLLKQCVECHWLRGANERITELEALVREAYEAWAGSEGTDFEPQTAPEAYLQQVIKWMLEPIQRALDTKPGAGE